MNLQMFFLSYFATNGLIRRMIDKSHLIIIPGINHNQLVEFEYIKRFLMNV